MTKFLLLFLLVNMGYVLSSNDVIYSSLLRDGKAANRYQMLVNDPKTFKDKLIKSESSRCVKQYLQQILKETKPEEVGGRISFEVMKKCLPQDLFMAMVSKDAEQVAKLQKNYGLDEGTEKLEKLKEKCNLVGKELTGQLIFMLVEEKKLTVLGEIIGIGASVEIQDAYGNTPLHYAVDTENLSIVWEIVKGLSQNFTTSNPEWMNKENEYKETPLSLAIRNGDAPIVRFLLCNGARVSNQLYDKVKNDKEIKTDIVKMIQDTYEAKTIRCPV